MNAFVMAIGVILMVIIHEGGHFVAAKSLGMKATEAFFGFGPKLWSVTRGETEYGVKALPLGGYVRITGMNMFEEVAPEDEGRTYREKPFWMKSVVVLAGIFSHFVVAFILLYVVVVVFGTPTGSGTLTIAGVELELEDTTTGEIVATPAANLGILPGDELVAVDGAQLTDWNQFVEIVRARPDTPTTITLERDGELVSETATLASRQFVHPDTGETTTIGYVGVIPEEEVERATVFAGVPEAAIGVVDLTRLNLQGLWQMISGIDEVLSATFGGGDETVLEEVRPISVIGLTRIGTQVDFPTALLMIAFVNVFVGLLNLVPLYPLDGGHFAVALWEKIRGQAPDVRKLLPVAAVVIAFVVGLGLIGVYLDIVNPLDLQR